VMSLTTAGLKVLRDNQIIHRDLIQVDCGLPRNEAPESNIIISMMPRSVECWCHIISTCNFGVSENTFHWEQSNLAAPHVERLTFEEFFTHPFFTQTKPEEIPRDRRPRRTTDGFLIPKSPAFKNKEESYQEDNLPFSLDDDSNVPHGSPSPVKRSPLRSTYGFSLDTAVDRRDLPKDMEISSRYNSFRHKPDNSGFAPGNRRSSEGNLKESLNSVDHKPVNMRSKVVDSLEFIDQEYVLVSGPLVDAPSVASVSKVSPLASKTPSRDIHSTSSAPLPIIGATKSKMLYTGSFESQCSAPSGTSHGSVDLIDASEQPSTDSMARIKSLQDCASAISELVNDKVFWKKCGKS
ncbi:hypothetical protein Tco_0683287, partial [Tanacetum coccineum]